MKLTEWFPPYIKPVHKGWYHTGFNNLKPKSKYSESDFNWLWDGNEWGFYWQDSWVPSNEQGRWWRGIAKD